MEGTFLSTLWLDLETYCQTPIRSGAHRYAEEAEVMLVAFAWDDEPVTVWDLTAGPHTVGGVQMLLDSADDIVIHNSAFDRTVLRHRGVHVPLEKISDTMVTAFQHSLPGALGTLCDVLGVPSDKAKDKDGRKLIQLFCKPCPKNWKVRRATRETHPDEWTRFVEYARLDVDAMRSVHGRLPHWNSDTGESELWRLDQRINDRGFAVDVHLARSAVGAFERASRTLATRAGTLTGGAVGSTTQRDVLLAFLREEGIEMADMTGDTVERLLREELPPVARELLEIRQQAAATSPAKYKALVAATSSDDRLRGSVQFCGAARTGRDCLAEGTLVLVKDDHGRVRERPVQEVGTDDLVWDGEAWVEHEGVVFSGDKNVIEHDGLLATTKHAVYISTTESMTLGEAKQKGLPLWRGNGTQFTS